jgi:precorrin-6B methylase 2
MKDIRAQMELVNLTLGAWRAQVLYTGVRLRLFEALASKPQSAAELAQATGLAPRSLERWLIAARSMKLIDCDGPRYTNGETVSRTLVPGRPAYVGNWVRLMAQWYRPWGLLDQAVATGECVEDPLLHLGENEEYTADFIRGMHDYANYRGADVLRHLDLSGRSRLIDVGGGPGTYAIMFCRAYPNLNSTVFDLPDVLKIAAQYVAEAGLTNRVSLAPGNYYHDELGEGYDVAFLSDMLHQEDAATGRMLLQKAYRALKPGGQVVVQAMFLNDDNSGPEWPALHNLLMLLIYRGGKAYSVAETAPWLTAAGFVDVRHVKMSFYNVNSLIVGHKP